ncbi:MAG: hypothetical protein M3436_19685 [Pseudomonadota bacterium]|nr:hypothetical protein [Pseudomonadota bacterium]
MKLRLVFQTIAAAYLLDVSGATAIAEIFAKRPATVIGVHREVRNNISYHFIHLRIEPKSRVRPESFERRLDIANTKYFSVSPTGRRTKTSLDAIKPGMRVLVSGRTSISGMDMATEIYITDKKP